MKFYLIDKNNVRLRFESNVVNGKVEVTETKNFSIAVHDVVYEIRNSSLDVISAEPKSEHAVAITENGLIIWKNQYRQSIEYKNRQPNSSAMIYDFNYFTLNSAFCSGYICLGKTPSDDVLKISAKDFRAFDLMNNEIKSPSEVGLKITETEDFLILEKKKRKRSEAYDTGPVINDKLYVITDFSNDYRSMKEVIPRGTCFKTYVVVDLETEKKPERKTELAPHELCY